MKALLLTIAIGILLGGSICAKPPGKITFGAPHQRVFPADATSPRQVYIELPVKITNTSSEAISFGTNSGPQFNVYVQRRTTSKHWSNITPTGMCGLGYSTQSLAPSASLDSTMLIQLEHGGRGYRLALPIYKGNSNRRSQSTIKSPAIILPKFKGQ
jgi:hypothetical protein